MVGYLVRLRLRLAWRSLTASTGRIVASAVVLLHALGLLVVLGADGAAPRAGRSRRSPWRPSPSSGRSWPCSGPARTRSTRPASPSRPAAAASWSPACSPRACSVPERSPSASSASSASSWSSPGAPSPCPLLVGVLQLVLGVVLCILAVRTTVTGLGAVLG
ncbi:hypothetical protein [Propionibacterium acidifaciens]|uniref:hypothetical protein n=1 Tax=Propionibacterium acidifaciens TaxID=556499 RepID=UPI000F4DD64F|nr:hypothetical protein [Propionibacterium acidifaciens]